MQHHALCVFCYKQRAVPTTHCGKTFFSYSGQKYLTLFYVCLLVSECIDHQELTIEAIMGMNQVELETACAHYDLKCFGTKSLLQTHLKQFVDNKAQVREQCSVFHIRFSWHLTFNFGCTSMCVHLFSQMCDFVQRTEEKRVRTTQSTAYSITSEWCARCKDVKRYFNIYNTGFSFQNIFWDHKK